MNPTLTFNQLQELIARVWPGSTIKNLGTIEGGGWNIDLGVNGIHWVDPNGHPMCHLECAEREAGVKAVPIPLTPTPREALAEALGTISASVIATFVKKTFDELSDDIHTQIEHQVERAIDEADIEQQIERALEDADDLVWKDGLEDALDELISDKGLATEDFVTDNAVTEDKVNELIEDELRNRDYITEQSVDDLIERAVDDLVNDERMRDYVSSEVEPVWAIIDAGFWGRLRWLLAGPRKTMKQGVR